MGIFWGNGTLSVSENTGKKVDLGLLIRKLKIGVLGAEGQLKFGNRGKSRKRKFWIRQNLKKRPNSKLSLCELKISLHFYKVSL